MDNVEGIDKRYPVDYGVRTVQSLGHGYFPTMQSALASAEKFLEHIFYANPEE